MRYFKDSEGKIYAFEDNGSQDHLISKEFTFIPPKEITTEINAQIKTSFDNLNYAQKRIVEYPSIGDQLDALFHAGMMPKELSDKIKEVKEKYPKN